LPVRSPRTSGAWCGSPVASVWPESPDDVVGVVLRPQRVDDLVEVPADRVPDLGEDRQRDRIHLPDLEVGVDEIDADRCLPNEGRELRTAAANVLFRSLAIGDVARRPEPFEDLAALVEEGHGARFRPPERAVDTEHPVLELERALRADRPLDDLHHLRLVVGGGCTRPATTGSLRGCRR
jgi:hypothetical protein